MVYRVRIIAHSVCPYMVAGSLVVQAVLIGIMFISTKLPRVRQGIQNCYYNCNAEGGREAGDREKLAEEDA
jgi:hypothetical protein